MGLGLGMLGDRHGGGDVVDGRVSCMMLLCRAELSSLRVCKLLIWMALHGDRYRYAPRYLILDPTCLSYPK